MPDASPAGHTPVAEARLDRELVRRGLARSRAQAADLIAAGSVTVAGVAARKPSMPVAEHAPVAVATLAADVDDRNYVSRAAHKLLGALVAFEPEGLHVAGRRCLDAGASTGGFTQVLLDHGAAQVTAVDVGHDQLASQVRADPRVRVVERTNVRDVTLRGLTGSPTGPAFELVVADLSFISLTLVLPALHRVAAPDADLVVLVKPQFEVGKARLGKRGVVTDPAERARAVRTVAGAAERLGLGARGLVTSPLPGPAGTIEYLLWLRADAPALTEHLLAGVVGTELESTPR